MVPKHISRSDEQDRCKGQLKDHRKPGLKFKSKTKGKFNPNHPKHVHRRNNQIKDLTEPPASHSDYSHPNPRVVATLKHHDLLDQIQFWKSKRRVAVTAYKNLQPWQHKGEQHMIQIDKALDRINSYESEIAKAEKELRDVQAVLAIKTTPIKNEPIDEVKFKNYHGADMDDTLKYEHSQHMVHEESKRVKIKIEEEE